MYGVVLGRDSSVKKADWTRPGASGGDAPPGGPEWFCGYACMAVQITLAYRSPSRATRLGADLLYFGRILGEIHRAKPIGNHWGFGTFLD